MWYSWATYKAAIEKENEMYINFRDDYQSYLDDLSKSLKSMNLFKRTKTTVK